MNKKAVFITATNVLDSYGNGGVKASQEHLKMVQECFGKENVYVCMFGDETDIISEDRIKIIEGINSKIGRLLAGIFGCKIYYPWKEKEIIEYINEIEPDLVFIDFSTLGKLVRKLKFYKTIVFFHNIESDYALNKVKYESLQYLPSYWAAKINDKHAVCADKVICLNKRDADRMYELHKRVPDMILPITFNDNFNEQKTTSDYKREILFLGSLFGPNQAAVEWFIENVMPRLSDITLNIVGKGFEKKSKEYARYENVNVIGTVEELDKYYYRHAIVVMPISYGAGMKVKTAEAMMYGRIILASDEALEGYDVDEVKGIYRCNTVEEYIFWINKFFQEAGIERFQADVRKCFLDKYETNRQKLRLEKIIKEIV